MKEKVCFCSTISNMPYFWGALGLYCSLQKVKTKYPFVFLMSDEISKKDLKKAKDIINKLNNAEFRIFKNFKNMLDPRKYMLSGDWCRYTIEKLSIFTLYDYDKVLFLDADIIVMDNIDFLMDKKFPLLQTIKSGNIELYGHKIFFISSYMIGIRPQDFNVYAELVNTIDTHIKKYGFSHYNNGIPWFSSDENIWPMIYTEEKINKIGYTFVNQGDFNNKLYHVITLGKHDVIQKYWHANKLYDYESIKKFIYNTKIEPHIDIEATIKLEIQGDPIINDEVINK